MTASPSNPFERYLNMEGADFTIKLAPGPRSPTLGDLDHTISQRQMEFFGDQAMAWVASRIIRTYNQHNVMPKNIEVKVSVKLDVGELLKPETDNPDA